VAKATVARWAGRPPGAGPSTGAASPGAGARSALSPGGPWSRRTRARFGLVAVVLPSACKINVQPLRVSEHGW